MLSGILPDSKFCCTCDLLLPLVYFNKNRSTKDGYHTQCKDCLKKYREKRKLKEPDYKHKEYIKNKNRYKESSKTYRKNHKEEYREHRRNWKKRHPEQARKDTRKRKAIKKQVKENYSIEDEKYTRKLFENKCFKCSSTKDLYIDHNYPLSKGFPLTKNNAVLLCIKCNSAKNNKLPEEFYTQEQLNKLSTLGIGGDANVNQ